MTIKIFGEFHTTTLQVKQLLQIAHAIAGDQESSIEVGEKLFVLLKTGENIPARTRSEFWSNCNGALVDSLCKLDKLDLAEKYANEFIQRPMDHEQVAPALEQFYGRLGSIKLGQGEYEEAERVVLKSLEELETYGNHPARKSQRLKKSKSASYQLLVKIYQASGNKEKEEEFKQKLSKLENEQ